MSINIRTSPSGPLVEVPDPPSGSNPTVYEESAANEVQVTATADPETVLTLQTPADLPANQLCLILAKALVSSNVERLEGASIYLGVMQMFTDLPQVLFDQAALLGDPTTLVASPPPVLLTGWALTTLQPNETITMGFVTGNQGEADIVVGARQILVMPVSLGQLV